MKRENEHRPAYLRLYERLRGEMEGVMQQVGFEGDLQAFFEFLNTDPQFRYPNTDEGRQAQLRFFSEIYAGISPEDFAKWREIMQKIRENLEGAEVK